MILAELVRRGRGDRILIVCPRHVLEQMQHELWTRFALPFVRLDSAGIQRVRQVLPATRNPFTYFKRVIISIDTLKQGRFASDLRQHRWDAVVIDESHNVTNSETQNNRLARVLAPNTEALILASATPHNGRKESFAELIRLLDPPPSHPAASCIADEVTRLVVRRHRHSPRSPRWSGPTGRSGASRSTPGRAVAGRGRGRPRAGRGLAAPAGGRAPSQRRRAAGSSPGRWPRRSCPRPPRCSRPSANGCGPARPRQGRVRRTHAPPQSADERPSNGCVDLNRAVHRRSGGKYGRLLELPARDRGRVRRPTSGRWSSPSGSPR